MRMASAAQRQRACNKIVQNLEATAAGMVQVHCTTHDVDIEDLQHKLETESETATDANSGVFENLSFTAYGDCLCMRTKPRQPFSSDISTASDDDNGLGAAPDSALDPCAFYFTCGALVMWSVPPAVEMQLVSHFNSYAMSAAREESEDSWLIETQSLKTATDTFTYSFGTRSVLAYGACMSLLNGCATVRRWVLTRFVFVSLITAGHLLTMTTSSCRSTAHNIAQRMGPSPELCLPMILTTACQAAEWRDLPLSRCQQTRSGVPLEEQSFEH